MTLTASENERLTTIEQAVVDMQHLIKGMGSKDQLNRLYVLAQRDVTQIREEVNALSTKVSELLELARSLQ